MNGEAVPTFSVIELGTHGKRCMNDARDASIAREISRTILSWLLNLMYRSNIFGPSVRL
jgi:hypothetical protein